MLEHKVNKLIEVNKHIINRIKILKLIQLTLLKSKINLNNIILMYKNLLK